MHGNTQRSDSGATTATAALQRAYGSSAVRPKASTHGWCISHNYATGYRGRSTAAALPQRCCQRNGTRWLRPMQQRARYPMRCTLEAGMRRNSLPASMTSSKLVARLQRARGDSTGMPAGARLLSPSEHAGATGGQPLDDTTPAATGGRLAPTAGRSHTPSRVRELLISIGRVRVPVSESRPLKWPCPLVPSAPATSGRSS